MGSAFGDLNGSGNQQVWLNFWYITYSQAGNYSTWGWEVRYYGNGWGTYGATLNWSMSGFATTGGTRFISSAERYDTYTVLGGGSFTRTHDANGYLDAGWMTISLTSDHSSVGSGSVSVHSGTPPRIPKVPGKPGKPSASEVLPTSMKLTWAITDNNGAGIDQMLLRRSETSDFASYVDYINAGNVTSRVVVDLTPGKTYHWRVYAHNGVGYSLPSDTLAVATLAGGRVKEAGAYVNAIPWEKVAGQWVRARPYEKQAGTWKTVR